MLKGYKVTDVDRKVKIGIAAKSLKDLIVKIKKKFAAKKKPQDDNKLYLSDGTLIPNEQYFKTVPAQTLLIWTNTTSFKTDADILYDLVENSNAEFLKSGRISADFFNEQLKCKIANLADILKRTDDKSRLSLKRDDSQWFEGIVTKHITKEKFLFTKSQDRVRTYYYKTRDELRKLSKVRFKTNEQIEQLETLLNELQIRLKQYNYFGCFFDRTYSNEAKDDRIRSICNSDGVFMCEGLWNKKICLYNPVHTINPYMSREQRLMFQMWNLDHQIERSRTIIPAVMNLIEKRFDIDIELLFDDLFTLRNLKLVHIICHDKGSHLVPNHDDKFRYHLTKNKSIF